MSDDEYYSDNNSDKSDSDVEHTPSKKPLFNIAIKKIGGASSSNNYDDSEPDDADSDEESDDGIVYPPSDDDDDDIDLSFLSDLGIDTPPNK